MTEPLNKIIDSEVFEKMMTISEKINAYQGILNAIEKHVLSEHHRKLLASYK